MGAIDVARLAGFATAYGLVLLAPGPNLLLVLDAACAGSVRIGLNAALGAACGAAALALVILTIGGLSTPSSAMVAGSQVVFGAVVVVLGVRAMRRSAAGAVTAMTGRGRNHFRIAFMTAFSNPFTALFFFAAVGGLGASPLIERATFCGVVFATAVVFFGAVTLMTLCVQSVCLGAAVERRALRWGGRAAGLALVVYGLAIVYGAAEAFG